MNPEEIRSLKDIPFHWWRLEQNTPHYMGPDPESYRSHMDPVTYAYSRKEHNAAVEGQVFSNIRLGWESCGCNDSGYGCSHEPYVHSIDWYSPDGICMPGIEVETYESGEDEETRISYKDRSVVIPTGKCSLQDFYNACVYMGLPLFFRERWQHLDKSKTVIGVVNKMIEANTAKGLRLFTNNLRQVNVLKKVARVTLDIETETGYDLTRMMAGGLKQYYTLFFVIDQEEYDAIVDQS